jgi:hypothetical protein
MCQEIWGFYSWREKIKNVSSKTEKEEIINKENQLYMSWKYEVL